MLRKFIRDDSGTETVEWAIMAGLIVAGLVLVVANIGGWVNTKMTELETDLAAAG